MLRFCVWNVPGISLLIPAKSGITYANQTGGYSCLQTELEGFLLPLGCSFEEWNQEKPLTRFFTTGKWHGWCGDGIDIETANFIDEVLRMTPHTDWLYVDRERLADSHEAWIHVRPRELRRTETIEWQGFQFERAIITWPNSD